MDTNDIRRSLESEYDIPFVVQTVTDGGEPAFIIGPKDTGKELFTIRITFRNRIRLHMDFLPQKYSADFIESMSRQPEENRLRFFEFAKLINSLGAKLDISVNNSQLQIGNMEAWPENWRDLRIHVTKMPVIEDGELNYLEAAQKWGSLLIGMILSLADIVPVETESPKTEEQGFEEGAKRRSETNHYERNPLNRKLCLASKGYNCAICGFNFEKKYGKIGQRFIHVHHIVPVSKLGPAYIIDPMKDLIPVCPNCHAMLHRFDPPLMPAQLKQLMEDQRE